MFGILNVRLILDVVNIGVFGPSSTNAYLSLCNAGGAFRLFYLSVIFLINSASASFFRRWSSKVVRYSLPPTKVRLQYRFLPISCLTRITLSFVTMKINEMKYLPEVANLGCVTKSCFKNHSGLLVKSGRIILTPIWSKSSTFSFNFSKATN